MNDYPKLILVTDVMNMQSQAPFAEEPRADYILNGYPHPNILAHTVTLNTDYPSPWHAYRNQMGSDQNVFLNVPDYTHSRGIGTRGSFSTVGTPCTASSDGRSDVSQERMEPRRGGRQQGSRLPEAGVQNVRQVRDVGACIRCFVLRERVRCLYQSMCDFSL